LKKPSKSFSKIGEEGERFENGGEIIFKEGGGLVN